MSSKGKAKIKRFAPKLHVKKDDKVIVLSGASKGKEGVILRMFPDKQRAIVGGVNMVTKHVKPTQNSQGGIEQMEASIHISNLMLIDPKTGSATRTGRKEVGGKSVRFSKKTGEIIK
jgi:large subunit ribosomal protein L24